MTNSLSNSNMEDDIDCPVPVNQIPLEEFKELSNSFFFSLAEKDNLNVIIFSISLISLPIFLYLFKDGLYIGQEIINQKISCLVSSLIFPLLIITRLLLGWNYINNRLVCEFIEYEESGWYDGQKWNKPLNWRTRDLLISQFEVRPVITKLKYKARIITSSIILGSIICYTL